MKDLNTFEPEQLNVRDIFCNNNVSYKVPDYQRRYSWKREQLEALWDDLYESFSNDKSSSYFLGSIVVVKNDKTNAFELIDGQQRLTTLMIMISVLSKTYPDINCINPVTKEEDTSSIDNETFENCMFYKKGKRRLTLQTAVEYDSGFNSIVIDSTSFASLPYPTKNDMRSENPEYNFKYTARFFYDRFNSLEKNDREDFIFFIFNNVKLIRITCTSVPFAIKLFQVMNDRGMPLSSSDIVKSYIMGRIDKEEDKEDLNHKFTANWKYIEDVVNSNDLKLDDFMVYYEYFKLKANPKKQVVDELKVIIENKEEDIHFIVDELKSFASSLKEVLELKNPVIYSLKYLPWSAYINTCLAAAWHVKYGVSLHVKDEEQIENTDNRNRLIFLMRRYFYLALISGKTLNQIKQTSFNLLSAIISKKPITDIETIFDESISKNRMIKLTYENLQNDVYGENFLKPLLLSIEYEKREALDISFVEINKYLHVDHVLPQMFQKDDDWRYVDKDKATTFINTLGNMALLYSRKNIEAVNHGFIKKCNIYQGLNDDGTPNKDGSTCFDTTFEIVNVYIKENRLWDIEDIKRRFEVQMDRISSLLEISEDMIEKDNNLINTVVTSKRKANVNLLEIGLHVGDVLHWYADDAITCEVYDEHQVLFNGEPTSLSKIAKTLLGYGISGPLCFKFNGKIISDIREEAEEKKKLGANDEI